MLYGTQTLHTVAVAFERIYENKTKSQCETLKQVKVEPFGLFIDFEHSYLGTFPDGMVGDNGLIEIKCLHSVIKLKDNNKHCYSLEDNKIRYAHFTLQ